MSTRVILVEDDRVVAEDIAEVLALAGHSVVGIAGSAAQALDVAQHERPEVALVDISIPGDMDGISLASRLRELQNIAVIFVTGHTEPEFVERASRSLPYGYLLKPFDTRALEAAVEMAVARRRADQVVREQGQWLSTLLGGIDVAVVATDDHPRIRFMNPRAGALLGADAETKDLDQCLVLRDEAKDRAVDPIGRCLDTGSSFEFPAGTALVLADGRRVPVEGSAAPLRTAAGAIRGAVVTFRDVSDRVERMRMERLESLGTLAAGVAHDFNNMLAVIMSSAFLAKSSSEHDAGLTRLLNDIQDTCERASSLTAELMAFARGGTRARRALAVAPLLTNAVSLALRGSGTRAVFELPPELWPMWVDEAQLSQVFVNLALNGRDAMAGKGRLDVGASNLVLDQRDPLGLPAGRYVEVLVRDYGGGIPEADLPRVFEPYFSTKSKGTGLGLASAHAIVRRHGGTISVSSALRQGTTFRVILPAAEGAPRPPMPSPAPERADGMRVLVMDDEEGLRRVLGACLKELGCEVELVHDGDAAAAAHRRALEEGRRFDLSILDLTVPGGTGGVAALERMREVDPEIVAIATTGYSDSEVLDDYARHGFAGALPKPYRFGTLALVLREALGKRKNEARR